MDSTAIRDAYAEYAKTHPRFVPCIDGVYVTEDPYRMILEGKTSDLPMFAGYTKDEFVDRLPVRADESGVKIRADIIEESGIRYFNVVENSVKEVAYAHMSNNRRSPLYVYRFAPSIPGYDDPGDFHSCDLWFFFETIQKCWRPYNGRHFELARRMCDYWSDFIKCGNPNGTGYDGRELPQWKDCNPDESKYEEMVFIES